jgi:hypothetical protein
MSKDKGNKEKKKAPNTEGSKSTSNYQAGKNTVSKIEITSNKNKK